MEIEIEYKEKALIILRMLDKSIKIKPSDRSLYIDLIARGLKISDELDQAIYLMTHVECGVGIDRHASMLVRANAWSEDTKEYLLDELLRQKMISEALTKTKKTDRTQANQSQIKHLLRRFYHESN